MDKVVPETDLFFAAEMMLIFVAINLFAIAASVESFKRLRETLFGKEEEEDDEEDEEEEKVIEGKDEDKTEEKPDNIKDVNEKKQDEDGEQ